jgi:hypothetical protein
MPNPTNKIKWTNEMISILKANHQTLTSPQLASKLGVGLTATRIKLYELKLYKMELEYWTEQQVEFLKLNYKTIGDTELAMLFNAKFPKKKGWTKKHIEKKRRYLKLKRTHQEKFNIYQRNKEAGVWAMCSTKMWQKRGVAHEGELRVWEMNGCNRVFIKAKKGFVWYNRCLWEQHFGQIPKGMIVRVKDNNPLNIVIENLELIDYAENQKRNIAIKMAKNPELRRANYLLNKIKKTIKTHEQQQHIS